MGALRGVRTERQTAIEDGIRRLIESGAASQRKLAQLLGMSRTTIARIVRDEPPTPRKPTPGRPRIPRSTIHRIQELDRVKPRLGHRTIAGCLATGGDGGVRTPPHAHTTIRRYREPRRRRRRRRPRFTGAPHPGHTWQIDDSMLYQRALTPDEKHEIALERLLRAPVDTLEKLLLRVRKGEGLLACARRVQRRTRGKKRSKGAFGKHLRRARSGRRVHVIGIVDEHSRVVWAADLSVRVDARMLAKSLVRAIRRAGYSPQYLKLDNDQCFHSALFREVCAELGIELVYGRPYWAQDQGRIERWWKTLDELMERVRGRKIHMLPLRDAQAIVDERREHYNEVRPHQTLSRTSSCPTTTPMARLREAERLGLRMGHRPADPYQLDEVVPRGITRRKVRRQHEILYGNRRFLIQGSLPGEWVEVERRLDPFGMPRLYVWRGNRLLDVPVIFGRKRPAPGGRRRRRPPVPGHWRPPWKDLFVRSRLAALEPSI